MQEDSADLIGMELIKVNSSPQLLEFRPDVNRLVHPFSMSISGPSQSGKTKFIIELIKHRDEMFTVKFSQILYFLPEAAQRSNSDCVTILRQLAPNIQIIYGLPKPDHVFHPLSKLIILDDLADNLSKDAFVQEIFTRHSHHENCSIIFTTQNYYSQSLSKTITRNCIYKVLFEEGLSSDILRILSSQLRFKPGFLLNCFVSMDQFFPGNSYKYLLLDGNKNSPMKRISIRSNIFPNNDSKIRPFCFFENPER